MKLSELKGEKALDAFADLLEPVAEIFSDENIVSDIQADKPKILILKNMLKNHKKSVTEIVAILEGKDPETYEISFLSIPTILVELMSDDAVVSLFTSQGQNVNENRFGSAMENTEEKEI